MVSVMMRMWIVCSHCCLFFPFYFILFICVFICLVYLIYIIIVSIMQDINKQTKQSKSLKEKNQTSYTLFSPFRFCVCEGGCMCVPLEKFLTFVFFLVVMYCVSCCYCSSQITVITFGQTLEKR